MLASLLAVCFICVICGTSADIKCGQAMCTPLLECTPVIVFLHSTTKPLRPSIVEFLRAEQCGFENSYPMICCSQVPAHLAKTHHTHHRPTKKHPHSGTRNDMDVSRAMWRFYDELEAFELLRKKREGVERGGVEIR